MKVVMATNLIPNRPKTGGEAAVWACKLIFLVIGVASTVVFLGKLAVPPLLSHSLPNLCKSVGPRHLFIAVNSIIILVWKLHGVQHHDDHHENHKSSYSTSTSSSDSHDPPLLPEPTVVDSSPSSDRCPAVMDLSDGFEIKNIILNEQVIGSDTDRSSSDPWPPPPDESSEDPLPENDTMDAMWRAIMGGGTSPDKKQNLKKTDTTTTTTTTSTPTLARASAAAARRFGKSDTFREGVKVASRRKEMRKSETFRESSASAEAAVPAATGWRGRDRLVIGQDELFNKVEAFIKMNYDQLRLQRQESEQRYVENNMVNAAY